MEIGRLRQDYHREICRQIAYTDALGIPNIADRSMISSSLIAKALFERLPYPCVQSPVSGQTAGRLFEILTRSFLEQAFALLNPLRPGQWFFSTADISAFEQYAHLALVQRALEENPALATVFGGDYLIKPDIVIARHPLDDAQINQETSVVSDDDTSAALTPLRSANQKRPLLHASISCKWTIRSDRAQNTRAEALNLIRNRKGRTPFIMVVTAEPLPSRLASLTMGTGDLDCTYHFALPELIEATRTTNQDQHEMLMTMVSGQRLRDISDLPFDLAI
jgi:hypothetical protein